MVQEHTTMIVDYTIGTADIKPAKLGCGRIHIAKNNANCVVGRSGIVIRILRVA